VNAKDLKKEVDILDVLEYIGGRIPGSQLKKGWDEEVEVFCPFCADLSSHKPAGRANVLKQLYHCWACGEGGDIFNLALRFLNTRDFPTAAQWIEDHFLKEATRWDAR
jgi:DNA primase